MRHGDGAEWVLQGTIVTDGTNAGNAIVRIDVGKGNVVEVLHGKMKHTDGSSRAVTVIKRDPSDNEVARFMSNSFANGEQNFPQEGTTGVETAPNDRIVSGDEDIEMKVASMSISSIFTFSISLWIWGGVPTVTLTSPTGATETTNTKQVV